MNRDPIEKLLFLYLLTNTLTNIVGIYEISLRRIAFDTGIDSEMVDKILKRFEIDDKIKYDNNWVAIKNFIRHQLDNPKINIGMESLLKEVPRHLIEWVNIDYDRLSHLNLNTNLNTNNNLNINNIYDYWNSLKIIVHKNNIYQSNIITALNKYSKDEIITAITNYNIILIGEQYFFKYKWTLKDFLKRGIDKFLDLEIAKNNYQKRGITNGKNKQNNRTGEEKPNKYSHLEEVH